SADGNIEIKLYRESENQYNYQDLIDLDAQLDEKEHSDHSDENAADLSEDAILQDINKDQEDKYHPKKQKRSIRKVAKRKKKVEKYK
ncbi:2624_t:CDS:1, partial [Cetraspora pellucida]